MVKASWEVFYLGLRESACCGGVFWLANVVGALLVKAWGAQRQPARCELHGGRKKWLWPRENNHLACDSTLAYARDEEIYIYYIPSRK